MPVKDEIDREETAKSHVVEYLSKSGASRPRDLVSSSAAIAPYTIRRAVWSLVGDGAVEFTSDYKVQLRS